MKQTNALTETFALAFHAERHFAPAFDDPIARRLFSGAEYMQMKSAATVLINALEPQFSGTPKAALERVVDRYLAPLPMARAAFIDRALENAAEIGGEQALFIGAGYKYGCVLPDGRRAAAAVLRGGIARAFAG